MGDDFMATQEAMFAAYAEGRYREAMELALAVRRRHPSRAARADYWVACLQCRLGDPDEALATLEAGLAAGRWPNPDRLRRDPDLEPIRDLPEMVRILEVSERRRQQQQAGARPELRVLAPPTRSLAARPPLLMALHTRGGDADESLHHWRAAVDAGALLAAPQATRVEGPHEFAWGESSEDEIRAHLTALERDRAFDRARLVLAGASQGARLAVSLALRGAPVESRGFIALVGAPEIDGPLRAAASDAAKRGLRGIFVTGDADVARPGVERAHAALVAAGMAVRLEVVPGLGHAFPADFDARLRAALAFVLDAS